jgi:GT2 family glycosyltransferase/glycosyltransferase involved in cell wall biosynthesis
MRCAEGEQHRRWIERTEPSFLDSAARRYGSTGKSSLVSVILLVESHDRHLLAQTLQSVRMQTYTSWEMLVVHSERLKKGAGRVLHRETRRDRRIRTVPGPVEDGNGTVDRALRACKGSHVMFLGSGDVLAPVALERLREDVHQTGGCAIVYGDEDYFDPAGVRCNPSTKPGWSPELLLDHCYVGRPALVSGEALRNAMAEGALPPGEEEWAVFLRIAGLGGRAVRVPGFLCHRPVPPHCEGADGMLCYAAIREHFARVGRSVRVLAGSTGRPQVVGDPGNALVSVVIPQLDHPDLLRRSLASVREHGGYEYVEFIIVDTGSSDMELTALYDELAVRDDMTVLHAEPPFSWSAACNAGARAAHGSLLLFLDNDIEATEDGWLGEMVLLSQLPRVGVVGGELFYPDGMVQHAGVMIGHGMLCAHLYRGKVSGQATPWGDDRQYRNLFAVSGACMLVNRDVFSEVGGCDEAYSMFLGDIAFCLAVFDAGYRIAYTPHTALIHHEGVTRGNVRPREDVWRFAQMIRSRDLDADPYGHPFLKVDSILPALRDPDERSVAEYLEHMTSQIEVSMRADEPLNIYDDEEVQSFVHEHSLSLTVPLATAEDARLSVEAAAQFVITRLRSEPSLRRRFPTALSDGVHGACCRVLCEEAGVRDPRVSENIKRAFARRPGNRMWCVYKIDLELAWLHPLALTPAGTRGILLWMLKYGRAMELTEENIWWFLLEKEERPAWNLANAYLLRPEWQVRFPGALQSKEDGDAFLTWLKGCFDIRQAWLENLSLPSPGCKGDAPATPAGNDRDPAAEVEGVNLLGYFCYPSGLQQTARLIVRALEKQGIGVSCRDIPVMPMVEDSEWGGYLGREEFPVTLLQVQAGLPHMIWYDRAALAPASRAYRIGIWYWELEAIPSEWDLNARLLQEVWAPSRFIADALSQSLSVPVHSMPPGLLLPEVPDVPRAEFGLDGRFLFLFMFDMGSTMDRKNPLSLIRAYRRAFKNNDRTMLVIKVMRGASRPANLARLKREAADADVTVIDEIMPRSKAVALMNTCDCYVSMHRSEGLGLTMAEAMLLGKPVIATGYSGNLEFMDETNSKLLSYRLVPLERDYWVYKRGSAWAEPDENEAAHWMEWAYSCPEEARDMAARGCASVRRQLTLESYGRRLAKRIGEIESGLGRHGV